MEILEFLTPKAQTYYIDANSTIRQALEKFDYHKFSVVSMVDGNGTFVSTVSEGDILRFIKNKADFDVEIAEKTRLKDIEKYRGYKSVKLDSPVDDVLELLKDQNFVPIVDDRGVYSGIIKRKTIIEYLYRKIKESKVQL